MSTTIGSVLLEQAQRLDSAQVIDDGLNNWKAEQIAKWWDEFDRGIQGIVAEVIRRWPQTPAASGDLKAILDLTKATYAELQGVMGVPDSFMPFTSPAPSSMTGGVQSEKGRQRP